MQCRDFIDELEKKIQDAIRSLAADDPAELPDGFRESVMKSVREAGSQLTDKDATAKRRWARKTNAAGKSLSFGTGRMFSGAFRSLRAAVFVVLALGVGLLISLGVQRLYEGGGENGDGWDSPGLLADASTVVELTTRATYVPGDETIEAIDAYPNQNAADARDDAGIGAFAGESDEAASPPSYDGSRADGANDALAPTDANDALAPTDAKLHAGAGVEVTTTQVINFAEDTTDEEPVDSKSEPIFEAYEFETAQDEDLTQETLDGVTQGGGAGVAPVRGSEPRATAPAASVSDFGAEGVNAAPKSREAADDDTMIRQALMDVGVEVIYSGEAGGAEMWDIIIDAGADGKKSMDSVVEEDNADIPAVVSGAGQADVAASAKSDVAPYARENAAAGGESIDSAIDGEDDSESAVDQGVFDSELTAIVAAVEESLKGRDYTIEAVYPSDGTRLLRVAVKYE